MPPTRPRPGRSIPPPAGLPCLAFKLPTADIAATARQSEMDAKIRRIPRCSARRRLSADGRRRARLARRRRRGAPGGGYDAVCAGRHRQDQDRIERCLPCRVGRALSRPPRGRIPAAAAASNAAAAGLIFWSLRRSGSAAPLASSCIRASTPPLRCGTFAAQRHLHTAQRAHQVRSLQCLDGRCGTLPETLDRPEPSEIEFLPRGGKNRHHGLRYHRCQHRQYSSGLRLCKLRPQPRTTARVAAAGIDGG